MNLLVAHLFTVIPCRFPGLIRRLCCCAILGLAPLLTHAAPTLVTSALPPATKGQPYSASFLVGSTLPLASAGISGLPAGLVAAHNGSGTIAITGTPAVSGTFTVSLSATDAASGMLSGSGNLVVSAVAENATSVSAGSTHTCAVINGGLQCWGSNDLGELGNNGINYSSTVPMQIMPAGSKVTAVAAGTQSSCAVVDGGLTCWGANALGQLGNNSTSPSYAPTPVIPAGRGVTAVTFGVTHACAVVSGGVQCWGDNSFRELGNNSAILQSLVPVQVIAAGSGVTDISAGYRHTCAIVAGGVQCWGYNPFGMGDGINTLTVAPVQVIAPGSNATSISVGDQHSCAVINGGVKCWGYNISGQLGNNTIAASAIPVQAIAAGSGVSIVAAGYGHTCAMLNGGVQCWGANYYGQVGGTMASESLVPVQQIAASSNVTSVSAGDSHSCAVVSGVVKCWGYNFRGQLGIGDTKRYSNTPVHSIAGGSGVSQIATGDADTCAVINGGLQCWGDNYAGQFGNNTTVPAFLPVQTIAAGSGVTAVTAARLFTCAMVNGGALCWGGNAYGQLGNNSTVQSLVPVQAIAAGSNVTAITSAGEHSCAVVNGGLQCWGNNSFGELGNNSTTPSPVPLSIIAAGSGVTAVSASAQHTCAVVNGGVKCWGDNTYGQLGNNSTVQSLVPVQVIAAGSNVTAVAAGSFHTCAGIGGGVKCWGDNGLGQLGNGTTTRSLVPVQTIAAGSGVAAIASGASHNCAVMNSGVNCWGNTEYGKTGTGDYSLIYVAAPAQAIAPGSNVTAISAASGHTCAVVMGGTACWGNNFSGQLADLPTAPVYAPRAALTLVTLALQTVNFPVASAVLLGSGPITLTASASSGLTNFIFSSGSPSSVCTVNGNQLTIVGVGNCLVTATQPGDANVGIAATTVRVAITNVWSRKMHGATPFDMPIDPAPPTPAITVEPRAIGAGHTIMFHFAVPVTDPGIAGVAPVGAASATASGNDVVVTLTGVPDASRVTVTLSGVNGGGSLDPPPLPIAFLIGDLNDSGRVTASDISAVKARSGHAASLVNFKADINASGMIDAGDVTAVRARAGVVLP